MFLALPLIANLAAALVIRNSSCILMQDEPEVSFISGFLSPVACSILCDANIVQLAPLEKSGFICACNAPSFFETVSDDLCDVPCPTQVADDKAQTWCGGLENSTQYWSLYEFTNIAQPLIPHTSITADASPTANEPTAALFHFWSPLHPVTLGPTTTESFSSSAASSTESLTSASLVPEVEELPIGRGDENPESTSPKVTQTKDTPLSVAPQPLPPPSLTPENSHGISPTAISLLCIGGLVLVIGLMTVTQFRRRLSRTDEEVNSSPLKDRFLEDDGQDPLTAEFSLDFDDDQERSPNLESSSSPPALNSIHYAEVKRSPQNVFAAQMVVVTAVSPPEESARPVVLSKPFSAEKKSISLVPSSLGRSVGQVRPGPRSHFQSNTALKETPFK